MESHYLPSPMALLDIELPSSAPKITGALDVFLREAEDRIANYLSTQSAAPLFVPCDFIEVYSVLHDLRKWGQTRQKGGQTLFRFCEWGSGFGVITCLAAMLGFKACGIEIEPDLVDQAEQLAQDFGIPAEFYCGSFLPDGFDAKTGKTPADAVQKKALSADKLRCAPTYTELGLDMKDFNVIFGYPWPDEEDMLERLFDRVAAPGALLVIYRGIEDLRIQKKTVADPRAQTRNR